MIFSWVSMTNATICMKSYLQTIVSCTLFLVLRRISGFGLQVLKIWVREKIPTPKDFQEERLLPYWNAMKPRWLSWHDVFLKSWKLFTVIEHTQIFVYIFYLKYSRIKKYFWAHLPFFSMIRYSGKDILTYFFNPWMFWKKYKLKKV